MIVPGVVDRVFAAVLISSAAVDDQPIRDALERAGGEVLRRLEWDDAAALADQIARVLVILDCEGVADDLLHEALVLVDRIAVDRGFGIIARITPQQIDLASAALANAEVQFLCDAATIDVAAAIAIGVAAQRDYLFGEQVSESEAARLARLNEEVARIADVLARLSRRPDPTQRPREAAPSFAVEPPAPITVEAADIRRLLRARRLRDRIFADGLFGDPAWDMILDLFAAHLERAHVSVSSLCIASGVPPTTALRWIGKLTEAGLFERAADPFDKRRAFMTLSADGIAAMYRYVEATRDQDLPLC